MNRIKESTKLTAIQIESIINKIVPLIANPEDHEFFRGILYVKAENSNSADFSVFVNKLLNAV